VSASRAHAAIIINPVSGTRGTADEARRRAGLAATVAERAGVEADVFVTERAGPARELAAAAVARGAPLVVAWGGDGTVNEVGCALAFGPARLAVVPGGSGNGLARELGVPLDAARALAAAFRGRDRTIDAGELDGRLFFNVAGVGLDAEVAHRFAARGGRRGLRRYMAATCAAVLASTPPRVTVAAAGVQRSVAALVVAVANSRQYGNGALVAPRAQLDDGRLDVVIVEARAWWRTAWALPSLFTGRLGRQAGVTMLVADAVELTGDRPLRYHVDGEPHGGGTLLTGRVHAAALRVRVPAA
jgi:diacylglycerol kinase (ATP)